MKAPFSEPGGAALSLGRGLHKSYSQSTQALKLCFEICIQDKCKTLEQLQSKGQIDARADHSCTQAVVSHKERSSDALHPARWELGKNANLQAGLRLNCILIYFNILDVTRCDKNPPNYGSNLSNPQFTHKEVSGNCTCSALLEKDRPGKSLSRQ